MRSSPPLKGVRAAGRSDDTDSAGWIWGVHAALAALANPERRILRVLATRNASARLPAGAPEPEIVAPDALERLLPPGAVHQGLAVRAAALSALGLEELFQASGPILVLDQVTDPQNVGAIFRSAAAFGAAGVVLQDRKSPPLFGVLAKAAAGAVDRVPHAHVVNIARAIEELGESGRLTVGLDGEARLGLAAALDTPQPLALALGSEGKGLRPLVAERCACLARIPIAEGMESLNVSTAAAIALYAATRRGSA